MIYSWEHRKLNNPHQKVSTPSSLLQFSDRYFEDYINILPEPTDQNFLSPQPQRFGIHHCHPTYSFVNRITSGYCFHYIMSGKAWIGDKAVYPGDIVFYHKDHIHNFASDSSDPCCYAWVIFSCTNSSELLKRLQLPSHNLIFHSENSTEIYKLFYEIMYTDHETRSLELLTASYLIRILNLSVPNHNQESFSNQPSRSDYIDLALKYITNNYSDPNFSIQNLSKYIGLSPVYFGTLFKKTMGDSPAHFLKSYRIKAAQTLLNATSHTIQEISFLVGFQNYQRFFELFRKYVGMTPSEYRNQRNSKSQTDSDL